MSFFFELSYVSILDVFGLKKEVKKSLTDGVIVGLKNLTQDFIFEKTNKNDHLFETTFVEEVNMTYTS